ncbi:hypothetical protein [Halovulum sp. GXIMD14793]
MLDFNSRNQKGDRFSEIIDQSMEDRQETPRSYLGASLIGEKCPRRIQYNFIGTEVDEGAGFSGRTKRIFYRGHQAEDWMAKWMREAGFDLRTEKNGAQFGFDDCDGRFKGHIDGVIVDGPNDFQYPALWEHKMLGAKGWGQLSRHGVAKAYPHYATQIAVYQAYMQLAENPALLVATNSDTMEIECQLVPFNQNLAQSAIDKAAQIISATDHGETLPRAADSSDAFVCRFCPYKGTCWQ